MLGVPLRVRAAAAVVIAPAAFLVIYPAAGHAAECGPGIILDPVANMCVVAAPPPFSPPPPPAWNGDPTPGFSVGVCAPIPFVSLCTGI